MGPRCWARAGSVLPVATSAPDPFVPSRLPIPPRLPLSCCSLLLLGFVAPTLYIWHTELRMRREFVAARAPAATQGYEGAAVVALGPSVIEYLMFAGPAGEQATLDVREHCCCACLCAVALCCAVGSLDRRTVAGLAAC